MASSFSLTYKDRKGQKSTVRLPIQQITAANLDDVLTKTAALQAALEPLTLGNLNQTQVTQNTSSVSDGNAASMVARRELKLLVTYEDLTTHKLYQTEIPAPELTNAALWSGEDPEQPDYTTAEWIAFVDAFEDVVQVDTHAVSVRKAKIVGRNL